MKIQLIQPPLNKGYQTNARSGCYAPLGLVTIATFLKKRKPNLEVEVLDGELLTLKEIKEKIDPDAILGLETKIHNYESAIEIASLGNKTIIGGVFASSMYKQIQKHRKIFDHIIIGPGSYAILDILNGRKDKIISGKGKILPISFPDRSFINLEDYMNNFKKQHPTWDFNATNINTNFGCLYDCYFCGRSTPNGKVTYRNPKDIWKEVEHLIKDYSVNYLVDFSESITSNTKWLESLLESKPNNINPFIHAFANVSHINEYTIKILKKLNVKHLFIGAESGNNDQLRELRKNFSVKKTLEAIKLSTDYEIEITPSFVLGLKGETEEKLKKTYEHAKRIKEISYFEEIFCSSLIPFPDTDAFRKIEHKLPDTDLYDPENLKKIWNEENCNVNLKKINSTVDDITNLAKYK
ncbi:B12-binding domain-containing radical SAM protein, partial [Desulfosarcina sp.]|nr:B12-binding domain-containing radical SAM protein [Desulfosarcina sp.]